MAGPTGWDGVGMTKRRSPQFAESYEALISRPGFAHVRDQMRELERVAEGVGLYVRVYTVSAMFTPPQHKGRMFFTIGDENGVKGLWFSAHTCREFFGTDASPLVRAFGDPARHGRRDTCWELTPERLDDLIEALPRITTIVGDRQA